MTFIDAMLAVGIVQGALFAIALAAQRRGPRAANRWLGLLLACIAIGMTGHWLQVDGSWREWPRIYLATTTVVFLFGPLLWLYLTQLTRPAPLRARHWVHVLPWLLNLALFLPLWLQPGELLVARLDGQAPRDGAGLPLLALMKWASLLAYTVAGLERLRRWRRSLEQQLANADAMNLRWLRLVLSLFLAGAVLVLPGLLLGLPPQADILLSMAMVALTLTVGVAAIRQPAIFAGDLLVDVPLGGDGSRTAQRSLSPERSAQLLQRLQQAMEEHALYRDRDLSLARLAAAIGCTPHQLSELLNVDLGRSFYDYINEQRIAKVQRELRRSDRAVLDLALEVGFNNKSTFNKAFKKVTGTTPSAWRRQVQAPS